jgi:hypothetical protein
MRTEEFLKELENLGKDGWRLIKKKNGKLRVCSKRRRKVCHCPITAVATRHGWRLHGSLSTDVTYTAAEHIGLSVLTTNRIMAASDDRPDDLSEEAVNLRGRLMTALLQ